MIYPSHGKKKERRKHFKKTKNIKTKVVCNPDFKLLVALGAPRSGFLADFQPAGASKSLPGLKLKSSKKTHPQKHLYIGI
jgi:hypothetical protein